MSNVDPTEGGSGNQAAVSTAYQQPTGSGGTSAKKTAAKKTATTKKTAAKKTSDPPSVAQVISRVARSLGVPPQVALAIAYNESGLDPTIVGDHGTSFGVYQLHQGGELGSHDAQWAFNVENNARQALGVVAQVRAQHPDWDWGAVAAAAQRPADQATYATNVNNLLAGYDSSGKHAVAYFTSKAPAAGEVASAGSDPSGAGSAMGSSKPLTVRQYLDDPYIAQNYGYLSAYLHDPEVGPILAKAARNGWGANQLLGALSKTKWWQHTSSTARAWQAQQRVDPATANQRLHQMTQQIQTLAQSTLGYKLDPQRAGTIANTAIASDWSSQQLQHAIGAEFHYHQAQHALQGAAGQTVDQFKQMSSQYLVPLSNHTLNKWTRGVLEGVYQPADFESYLKAQAASLYPTLKGALDQGHTVQDFLNPYAELAAQTLEISPDSIDWFHPKWSKALNTTTPDGQRAPMSLSDWSTYLRSLPEYKHTQQAGQQAASLALNLATTFGKVSV